MEQKQSELLVSFVVLFLSVQSNWLALQAMQLHALLWSLQDFADESCQLQGSLDLS
jgi:hypothetical protein